MNPCKSSITGHADPRTASMSAPPPTMRLNWSWVYARTDSRKSLSLVLMAWPRKAVSMQRGEGVSLRYPSMNFSDSVRMASQSRRPMWPMISVWKARVAVWLKPFNSSRSMMSNLRWWIWANMPNKGQLERRMDSQGRSNKRVRTGEVSSSYSEKM